MPQDNNEFDFKKTLKAIQEGKPLMGKEGVHPINQKSYRSCP